MSYNQNYNYGNPQYWDRDRDRDNNNWNWNNNNNWDRDNWDRRWDNDWDDWSRKYKKKLKKLNRKIYRRRRYNNYNYLYYWWNQWLYPIFGWRYPVPLPAPVQLTPYTPAQIYQPTDPNYPLQPNIYNT